MSGAAAWSGGQYSLYRMVFGTYLAIHFVGQHSQSSEIIASQALPHQGQLSTLLEALPNILSLYHSPTAVTWLVGVSIAAAVIFAIGWCDRLAAALIFYTLACLSRPETLDASLNFLFLEGLLLAHTMTPKSPYGSILSLGREDPGGGWRMPWAVWGTAWIAMSVGYAYSGYTKLMSPEWLSGDAMRLLLEGSTTPEAAVNIWLLELPQMNLRITTWIILATELLFLPLALLRWTRGWAWLLMLVIHLSLLFLVDSTGLTAGMLMLHMFTFDPAWLSRPAHEKPRLVFYDGTCGLCHRVIRLLLAEDTHGMRFRFAPLQGETFAQRVPEAVRNQLPDSLVVVNPDAKLRVKGEAVSVLLTDLGGLWRILSLLLGILPSRLKDVLYDLVAGNRTRVFGTTEQACPMLPAELRERFQP